MPCLAIADRRTRVVLAALFFATIAPPAVVAQTLTTPTIRRVFVSPQPVIAGRAISLTVELVGSALTSAGLTVDLSSNNPAVPVPATTTIPSGQSVKTIAVQTQSVRSVVNATITATLRVSPTSTSTVSFPVAPLSPIAIQLNPASVFGGTTSTAVVVLNSFTDLSGLVVPLRSSNGNATVPTSITVPQRSDRQTFTITTSSVATLQAAIISALGAPTTPSSSVGAITDGTSNTIAVGEQPVAASSNLILFPVPQLQSLAAAPSPVTGGDSLALNLSVLQAAVPQTTTRGTTILPPVATAQLTTDHPEIVRIPASIQLLPTGGATATGFTTRIAATTVAPPADQTVNVTASVGGSSVSTAIVVKKPILPIAALSMHPASVAGGSSPKIHIQWNSAFSGQTLVSFTSNHPELVTLPPPATLQPTSGPTQIPILTSRPASQTVVTITATAGRQQISTTLTITP